MSYFHDGVVYIVVPDADITEEMINNAKNSFNANDVSMRKTIDGTATPKTIFKIRVPVSHVFDGYVWRNSSDIHEFLEENEDEWRHPGLDTLDGIVNG